MISTRINARYSQYTCLSTLFCNRLLKDELRGNLMAAKPIRKRTFTKGAGTLADCCGSAIQSTSGEL
jgi:hypothetical protein